jgi:excisionase family DNA binding protein
MAKLLDVCLATIDNMDRRGELTGRRFIGRKVRYSAAEVDDWIAAGCPPRDEWEDMRQAAD